jgi:hypothetical protein
MPDVPEIISRPAVEAFKAGFLLKLDDRRSYDRCVEDGLTAAQPHLVSPEKVSAHLAVYWANNLVDTGRCAICDNAGVFTSAVSPKTYLCVCPNGRALRRTDEHDKE